MLATVGASSALRFPRFTPLPRWVWWLLAGAALLACRWSSLWVPHQQNPDESQLIAGAITLRHDPVFWRSVDGGTAGPLDVYPLLPTAWAGGIHRYAAARALGLAVIFGTIFFAGEALALLAGVTVARAAVLPALAFHALTTHPDFLYHSTELMPSLLLAIAGAVIARQILRPASAPLWLIGLLLGATPWAKPQAMPLAGLLWLFAMVHTARPPVRFSPLPLIVGALLPALGFFGLATATGQLEHLITPFFLNNFFYVNANAGTFSWGETLALQWQNALTDGYLGLWLIGGLVFGLFALARLPGATPRHRRVVAFAGLLLIAGAACALGPRRPTPHHLHFLMLPLIGGTGAALALALRNRTSLRPIIALFLFCTLVPLLVWRLYRGDAPTPAPPPAAALAQSQLVALIGRLSAPDEPLAVWGWRSSLYVEAGRPQATRQAQSEAQIYSGPLQSYFLRRYLEDFQNSQPPVFVDAVGPGNFAFEDRGRAHEAFQPLRTWVAARYTYVTTLGGARLYARNDRVARLQASALP